MLQKSLSRPQNISAGRVTGNKRFFAWWLADSMIYAMITFSSQTMKFTLNICYKVSYFKLGNSLFLKLFSFHLIFEPKVSKVVKCLLNILAQSFVSVNKYWNWHSIFGP